MAILAAESPKLKFKQIISKLNKIQPVKGRLEKVGKLKNNAICILDYAHSPDALEACLKNLKEQFCKRKISIVLGCGGNRDKSKRPIIGKIADKYCNKIYLTDDNPRFENPNKIRRAIKKNISKNKLLKFQAEKKLLLLQ